MFHPTAIRFNDDESAIAFSAPTKVRMRVSPSSVSLARVVTSPTWPRLTSSPSTSIAAYAALSPGTGRSMANLQGIPRALWPSPRTSPPISTR